MSEPPAESSPIRREQAHPAFAPIVSDAFERQCNLPEAINIAKGETLIRQGSRPEFVFLLRDGLLKLTHVTSRGRENILGLRAAGWYTGGVSALTQKASVYTVRTVTPCVVSRIPAEEFSSWLMQNAKRARHFTETLCNELMSQSAKARATSASAQDRLSIFLRESALTHPRLKTLDTFPLLKRTEVAQLLAITPEHLSRLLNRGS